VLSRIIRGLEPGVTPPNHAKDGAAMTTPSFDPRLTTYFGDATLQAGFLPLPHLFLRHYAELGLTGQQAMFVMQIMAVSWDLGKPPTTLSDIARRMGIARRTAQGISAELHSKGLIAIYDQYDDGGAQTENAYDLQPLFARLATFAPASIPSGTQRQQRVRSQITVQNQDAPTAPVNPTASPPDPGILPWQESASPPGRNPRPPLDPTFHAPQQEAANLNTDLKNLRKSPSRTGQEQQQKTPVAVAAQQLGWIGREEATETGRSLRWDEPLSAAEVRQSRQALARIGLNADVADAVAPTLHPAEVWALWLHARSAGLGCGWIAAQIYDRQRRRPRMAGIPSSCDAVGRLLAALPPNAATIVIDTTDKHAPEELETAQAALAADAHYSMAPEAQAAFDGAWSVMVAERQGWARGGMPQEQAAAAQGRAVLHSEDPCWTATKAVLQATIPEADYRTWIAPLTLLHVEQALVVVAAPNCFVQIEVQRAYALALQNAVELTWSRAMAVEVVIELAQAT